jgi:hypothetical protein
MSLLKECREFEFDSRRPFGDEVAPTVTVDPRLDLQRHSSGAAEKYSTVSFAAKGILNC